MTWDYLKYQIRILHQIRISHPSCFNDQIFSTAAISTKIKLPDFSKTTSG